MDSYQVVFISPESISGKYTQYVRFCRAYTICLPLNPLNVFVFWGKFNSVIKARQ